MASHYLCCLFIHSRVWGCGPRRLTRGHPCHSSTSPMVRRRRPSAGRHGRPVLVGGRRSAGRSRDSSTASHSFSATMGATISSSIASSGSVRAWACGPSTAFGPMPTTSSPGLRFLAERRGGKSVWQADRQDVIAFHRARRLTDGPGQIAASSWNRSVTALEKFYGWAWEEGLVAVHTVCPWDMTAAPAAQRGAIHTAALPLLPGAGGPAARHAVHRHGPVHPVSAMSVFGHISSTASVDPAWRGHNGERDAFSLNSSRRPACGSRRRRAFCRPTFRGTMTRCSVTCGRARSLLPPAICKGGKGREIRIPRRLLRRIDDYIDHRAANAVARWRARRGWERVRESDPRVGDGKGGVS